MEGIQIGEEELKVFLLAGDMIVYIEKIPPRTNNFNKVAG